MSIEDRNLKPGTVLVARYKKQDHRCEVVEGEGGRVVYRLKGGKAYASPSAAGSAVMGGVACNGWRFWSVEGTEPKAAAKKTATKTAAKKAPARKASAKKAAAKKTARKAAAPKGASAAAPEPPTEKPVGCGDCGQEFPNGREAAEHMEKEHGSASAQPGPTQ